MRRMDAREAARVGRFVEAVGHLGGDGDEAFRNEL